MFNFFALPVLAQGFIIFITCATGWFLITSNRRALEIGPTILTTTGIFATFLGIALGLSDFHSDDLVKSLPRLLESLQTAFWSSVFGIGGALLLKFRQYISKRAMVTDETVRFPHTIQPGPPAVAELSSRVTELAESINARLDQLSSVQTNAVRVLATSSAAVLIEALDKIVTNFNLALTDQFGENFRNFDKNIEKLIGLHEQKTSLDESHREYQETVTAFIEKADVAKLQNSLSELNTSIAKMDINFRRVYEHLSILKLAPVPSRWSRILMRSRG